MNDLFRCEWCGSDPLYVDYHDTEWGVPVHDDHQLFEILVLEGAQTGLTWLTILQKREHYRRAFHDFDPEVIARYDSRDHERLMADSGIVRNRHKIEAAIRAARGYRLITKEHGSFSHFLWRYIGGKPRQNAWKALADIPASTPEAERMSHDLRRFGFNLVGPTVCYAFMQAVGMVNDHVTSCHRHPQVARLS
jgi:DNA-3-methyladenine glycosylase I